MRDVCQQAAAQGHLFRQGMGHPVKPVRQVADFATGINRDGFPVPAGFQSCQRSAQFAQRHSDAASQDITGKQADQQDAAADPIERSVDGVQKDLFRIPGWQAHHPHAGMLGGQIFAEMQTHLVIGQIDQNGHSEQNGQKHQASDARRNTMHVNHRQIYTPPRIPSESFGGPSDCRRFCGASF